MDQRADWPCSHVVARSLANKGESVLLVEAFATDIYLRARISTKRASRAWCARAYITLHTHTWSNTTWWTERPSLTNKEGESNPFSGHHFETEIVAYIPFARCPIFSRSILSRRIQNLFSFTFSIFTRKFFSPLKVCSVALPSFFFFDIHIEARWSESVNIYHIVI